MSKQKSNRAIVKAKKRKNKLRLIAALIIGLLILVFALYLFFSSSVFDVKTIEINGNIVIDAQGVANEAGIKKGVNIFTINKSKAKDAFKKYSYVQSVSITRKFPSTIVIDLTEKSSYCIVEFNGVFYHCDMEGNILSFSDTNDSYQIPLVTGLEKISTVVGNNIKNMGEYKNAIVFYVLDYFYENDVLYKISEIHVSNSAYYIYLRQGGVLKFTAKDDFTSNLDFALYFVQNDNENAIVELIYNNNPIYKTY